MPALTRLNVDGLLRTRQGAGTYVLARPSERLGAFASSGDVPALMRCIEARMPLEAAAARLAAERARTTTNNNSAAGAGTTPATSTDPASGAGTTPGHTRPTQTGRWWHRNQPTFSRTEDNLRRLLTDDTDPPPF